VSEYINFNSTYVNSGAEESFPLPAGKDICKIVIDLQEGVTINSDETVTANVSTPFTLNYVYQ
jgi:hypothetical protein